MWLRGQQLTWGRQAGGKFTWRKRAGFLGGVTPFKNISSLSGDSAQNQKTQCSFSWPAPVSACIRARPWLEESMGSNYARVMLPTFIQKKNYPRTPSITECWVEVLNGALPEESVFRQAEPVCNSSALLFFPGALVCDKESWTPRNVLGISVLSWENMTKHFSEPISRQESFFTISSLRRLWCRLLSRDLILCRPQIYSLLMGERRIPPIPLIALSKADPSPPVPNAQQPPNACGSWNLGGPLKKEIRN